jgi:hypothetical protein
MTRIYIQWLGVSGGRREEKGGLWTKNSPPLHLLNSCRCFAFPSSFPSLMSIHTTSNAHTLNIFFSLFYALLFLFLDHERKTSI